VAHFELRYESLRCSSTGHSQRCKRCNAVPCSLWAVYPAQCLPASCLPVCLAMQGRLAAEADAHTRNVEDLQRFLQQVCSQAGAAPRDGAELPWPAQPSPAQRSASLPCPACC
jgi:hypothetical protein